MDVPQIQISLPRLPELPTVRLPATVQSFAQHLETAADAGATAAVHSPAAHAGAVPTSVASRAAASAATLGAMLRAAAPLGAPVGGLGQVGQLGGFAGVAGVQTSVLGPVQAAAGPLAGHAGVVAPVAGRVTSLFGPRVHPVTGQHRDHHGLDIAAPAGTPVRSITDGVVVRAEDAGGYGLLVEVDHGNGTTSRYAHMERLDVAVGDRIDVGHQVGAVGSTGTSTGPHLHVEVRQHGEPVDPDGLW